MEDVVFDDDDDDVSFDLPELRGGGEGDGGLRGPASKDVRDPVPGDGDDSGGFDGQVNDHDRGFDQDEEVFDFGTLLPGKGSADGAHGSLGSSFASASSPGLQGYLTFNPTTPGQPLRKTTAGPESVGDQESELSTESARSRKALIEEGRRRMEEFRKRSATPKKSGQTLSFRDTGNGSSPTNVNRGNNNNNNNDDHGEVSDVEDQHEDDGREETREEEQDGVANRRQEEVSPSTNAAAGEAARARQKVVAAATATPFTPVARGFKNQLDKLKRDELDLAAAEWSEQRKSVAVMRQSYEQEIGVLEERLKGQMTENQDLIAEVGNEKEEARRAAAKADQLRDRLDCMTTDLDKERALTTSLRSKVQELASELEERARDSVTRLASSQSAHDADAAMLKNQLNTQAERIAALQAEKAQMEEMVEAKSREVEGLRNEVSGCRDEIHALKTSLDFEKAAAQRELDHAREEMASLVSQSADARKAEQLAETVEDLGTQLESAKGNLRRIKKENLEMEMELSQARQAVSRLQEEQSQNKAQYSDELKLERQALEEVRTKLCQQGEELVDARNALEAALEEQKFASSREAAIKTRTRELEEKLAASSAAVQQLEASNRTLRDDLAATSQATTQHDDAQADLSTRTQLEADCKRLRSKLARLADSTDTLERRLSEEVRQRRDAEEAIERIESKHMAQLRSLRQEYDTALQEQRSATARLRDMSQEDKDVNLSVFNEMKSELEALRTKLQRQAVVVQAPAEPAVATDPHLETLQNRVDALEASNKMWNRYFAESPRHQQHSNTLIAEQAQTIHQLTMEIEAERKRCDRARTELKQLRAAAKQQALHQGAHARGRPRTRSRSTSSDLSCSSSGSSRSSPPNTSLDSMMLQSRDISLLRPMADPQERRHRHRGDVDDMHSDGAQDDIAQDADLNDVSMLVPAHLGRQNSPKRQIEYLKRTIILLRHKNQIESEARKAAETKVQFLQAEFTDLFVSGLAMTKQKKKKAAAAPTAAGGHPSHNAPGGRRRVLHKHRPFR
ncbi:Hypothetical protein (Fragment) [Durusdinium trenchii]|uniref:Centrosomal protein of 162 kDa n=1 Tax=Durusdinium trenchii TaxID=1381693 RepID=A0ABP0K5L1_9DINO